MPTEIECAIPVLPVKNLKESLSFYTKTLGFKLEWGDGEKSAIGSVSRDDCHLMLSEMHGERKPTWVWIGLSDDTLFEDYRAKGVKVLQEPCNQAWAYEMKFEDNSGNVLWLGTAPKKDLPIENTTG